MVPYIAKRFIAFSIPDDRRLFVISYEGIHELNLGPEISVQSDFSCPEGVGAFNGKKISYKQFEGPTLGLYGGTPILVRDSCEVLDLKAPEHPASDDGTVELWGPDGELLETLPFVDYSGDWQCATFSTDYRHIVIGTPYTVAIYHRG